jgi:hypothetical protein
MESPDPHLNLNLIAKAVENMHKHLPLLREQFASIYPKEDLTPKTGKGWLVDALEFDLKTLERGLGITKED